MCDIAWSAKTGSTGLTEARKPRLIRTLAHAARVDLAGGVDHAEAVALGVGKDHVVGIRRSSVPVDLGRAEVQQPVDLRGLIFGVQVEVEARRDVQRRANLIEREVRARAVGGAEKDEVVARSVVATDIAEGCLPELRLPLQIIDAEDDRADAEHYAILCAAFDLHRRSALPNTGLGEKAANPRILAELHARTPVGVPASRARG
jgi:hypothetical protein